MGSDDVELIVEVSKSPRGRLAPGAQMTGTVEIVNNSKKEFKVASVAIELCEVWNDRNYEFGPKERKPVMHNPMSVVRRTPGEGYTHWHIRMEEYMRKHGMNFHYAAHETQSLFPPPSSKEKMKVESKQRAKWQFTLALPAKPLCEDRGSDWRFEIQGIINDDEYTNILIVPSKGSKVKPSWYFEPIEVVAPPAAAPVQAGQPAPQGPPAVAPPPSRADQQVGYVGSFTVIPKGQKAALLIRKGDIEGEYKISFQTPGTMRSDQEFKQMVDPDVLAGLMRKLDQITAALNVVRGLDQNDPTRLKAEKAHEALKKFGHVLFLQMIPEKVQEILRNLTITMDFGLHESLVGYPWELLHDGTNFLCLKIPLGRFVSSADLAHSFKYIERGKRNGVKLLLIVDPDGSLPGARAEGEALKNALSNIAGVDIKLLAGAQADKTEVLTELAGGYDFIHYSGHAVFDSEHPDNSGLLLADGILKAYTLSSAVKGTPPILAFINACEAGRQENWSKGETKYENQVAGLASAFLVNGINFIGPYWPVYDDAALTFSVNFYTSVLAGVSLGESVRRAKNLIFTKFKGEEIAWASYSFYGDPSQSLEFEK